MVRRVAAVGAVFAVFLAGCAAAPKLGDSEIANASDTLAKADTMFRQQIEGEPKDAVSVADNAKCFFERAGDQQIGDRVYCGPLKVASSKADWAAYAYQAGEKGSRVELGELNFEGYEDPQGYLFRTDGATPASPESVTSPAGQVSEFSNFAAMIPLRAAKDIEPEPLAEPVTLKEPAVTIKVAGRVELATIPGAAIAALDSGASGDGAYRPAEGQQVVAWQIDLGPAIDLAPALGASLPSGVKDATATLSVQTSGTALGVVGGKDTPWEDGGTGVSFTCPNVPCSPVAESSYLLVVSAASLDGAELIAATAGEQERAPLNGGAVTSEHSSVLYDAKYPRVDLASTPHEVRFTATGSEQNIEGTYSTRIPHAHLTSFEVTQGWAPAGQAWLILTLEDEKLDLREGRGALEPETWSVQAGEATVTATDVGVAGRVVFQVPADERSFAVVARPRFDGSVATQSVEAEIRFP